MQFEEQVITVRRHVADEEGLPFSAMVGIGTCLACQPTSEDGQAYQLLHVQSGPGVGYCVDTKH